MKQIFLNSKSLSWIEAQFAFGWTIFATVVFVLLLSDSLVLPSHSLASEAPLDTLNVETLPKPEPDPRYKGANIPISRKLLPEAKSTTVPRTLTPSRPPRLDEPMAARWHSHLANRAQKEGNSEEQLLNQEAASRANPENPRYLWPVIVSALKQMDFPTLLEKLPSALMLQFLNPVFRGPMVIAFQQSSLLLLGVFWSVLVLALTIAWWRYLAHDLSALLLRGVNHKSAVWIPILLPLAFLVLRPGWFGFLALMSVPLLIQTRGRSRQLLAGTWILVILLAFPLWPILKNSVPTIDPTSEVNLLAQASTLNASRRLRNDLKQRIEQSENADQISRLTTALAIQEARRGRYKKSNNLFKVVLEQDSSSLPAMVGLANNMYYLGHLDNAADLYYKASLQHPDKGVILHNQAQVYFKKLFIPEAGAALDKSRDLGYRPPNWKNQKLSNKTYSPVIYPGLSNDDLQKACAWESNNYPAGITIMNWEGFLGIPPFPLFLLLSVPLLIAGALILLWSHQHDPRECENCGVAVCGDCCVVRQDSWLCEECGGIVDRARSDMILATLLKNRSRSLALASTSQLIKQSRAFPGTGHFIIGKIFPAWFRISLISWGTFIILAGWAFTPAGRWMNPGFLLPQETIHPLWIPLPITLWEGWLTPMSFLGACLIISAWLLAAFDGSQIRHQSPERFSLSLSSTRTKQETTESHSVSVS